MPSQKRLTRKTKLATLGVGTAALVSTAAIAGTATMTLSFFSKAKKSNTTAPVTIPAVVASAATLFSISGSAIAPVTIDATKEPTVGTSGTSTSAPANKTQIGINLATIADWQGERAFMNLAAGSKWRLVRASGAWEDMPADYLTDQQNPRQLATGEQAVRTLSVPNAAFLGRSVEIQCTWSGQANVRIDQNLARNVFVTNNSARFTWVPRARDRQNVFFTNITSTNPVRNFDCREAGSSATAVFHPDFIATVGRYKVARFMDWQNTNANSSVQWANRTTPSSGIFTGKDGVALEHMVTLANQAKVDPWFNIPWNADDAYIRSFAQYVKANLNPAQRAYVELSNEVWNYGFVVAHQAKDEGVARNLDDNPYIAAGKRYSQRSREVMAIWTEVFADQPNRIVRVIACQNANWDCARVAISFGDTKNFVDAIATAPYFHGDFSTDNVNSSNWANLFTTLIPERIAWVRARYMDNLALAKQYNKRLIAYEAGQHWTGSDVDTLTKLQRDPRMGAAYTQYLRNWDKDVGDLMVLFNDVGVISRYGAWGLKEYVSQPDAEAPKYRAVMDFIAALPK